MIVNSIKTHKITSKDSDINLVLDKYITELEEHSVVAVTSKIVSITEGRVVPFEGSDKEELFRIEADKYLELNNKYNVHFGIKNNILAAGAGIDESNGDGNYVLWPANPQESANKIREYLANKFNLKNIGVVITDSKTTPLRWGVTGFCLAHSGFSALRDYIGKEDLFGREFKFEKLNIADSIAASAVLVMGEGSESTPLAIVSDLVNIDFQDRNPTEEELNNLKIDIDDDLYGLFLNSVDWKENN